MDDVMTAFDHAPSSSIHTTLLALNKSLVRLPHICPRQSYIGMACYVEEEYDWSDGPLDPPSPEAVGPSRASPFSQEKHDLFVSETTDDCALPIGSPLPFGTSHCIR
jgi:hypothetical protein